MIERQFNGESRMAKIRESPEYSAVSVKWVAICRQPQPRNCSFCSVTLNERDLPWSVLNSFIKSSINGYQKELLTQILLTWLMLVIARMYYFLTNLMYYYYHCIPMSTLQCRYDFFFFWRRRDRQQTLLLLITGSMSSALGESTRSECNARSLYLAHLNCERFPEWSVITREIGYGEPNRNGWLMVRNKLL